MPKQAMDISVIIATRNRAALLGNTLSSLAIQSTQCLSVEVVVVDNGRTDDTQSVLNEYRRLLRLVVLTEETAGKSRALNKAMDVANGEIFLFTDDDVTPSPKWIQEFAFGERRYPSVQVFCGPIVPQFESPAPDWLTSHHFAGALFGRFDPQIPEGPLPEPLIPFGANFAVRSSSIPQARFRVDLGPSLENGPIFGEDTEFLRRLQAQGAKIVFLPFCAVFHHVPDRCQELSWISERAFNLGRGHVADLQTPLFIDKEIFRQRSPGLVSPLLLEYERSALLNFYFGQLFQFQVLGKAEFDDSYRRVLEELAIRSGKHLLCQSARHVLSLPRWKREQQDSA
jgi:glycosyltransferase involved in cell wall biosynthesis